MNTSSHDFVTVEMRGLKAALVTRARAQRVSVSELVRSAVARDLGLSVEGEPRAGEMPPMAGRTTIVKLSIRMTSKEASQLAAAVPEPQACRAVLTWPDWWPTCPCCQPVAAGLNTSPRSGFPAPNWRP